MFKCSGISLLSPVNVTLLSSLVITVTFTSMSNNIIPYGILYTISDHHWNYFSPLFCIAFKLMKLSSY